MGALRVLIEPKRHHYHLPWLEAVRPQLEHARPVAAAGVVPSGRVDTGLPQSRVPDGPAPDASAQLARVRATPGATWWPWISSAH